MVQRTLGTFFFLRLHIFNLFSPIIFLYPWVFFHPKKKDSNSRGRLFQIKTICIF